MKRSVNFSAPRKFALMAAMRNSDAQTWLCEPSSETTRRCNEDCAILESAGKGHIAVDLKVAIAIVTTSEPHQNLGDLIYAAFDAGWRADWHGGFVAPDGSTRKSPTRWWWGAMKSIEMAQEIRNMTDSTPKERHLTLRNTPAK